MRAAAASQSAAQICEVNMRNIGKHVQHVQIACDVHKEPNVVNALQYRLSNES